MSAVSFSCLCWWESTRKRFWTSQCGLSCNVGWMGVWLQTPSPGPLFRHRRRHMIIPHPEDQRLQSGVPGLQTDDPGHPSDEPEGWMNLKILHVLDLPSEGLLPQNLVPEILLQSTFLQPWTLKTQSQGQDYLGWGRWWENTEESLRSSISVASSGCHIIQGHFQDQPFQVLQGPQGVFDGSWRDGVIRQSFLVGSVVSGGYHGFYCPHCSGTKGRRGGAEDNSVRDP